MSTAGFEPSAPKSVVEGSYYAPLAGPWGRTYDIAPDGERFLMIKRDVTANADDPFAGLTQIHIVLNWFTDLQARVPTGR